MAWSPLARRKNHLAAARQLAARTSALLGGSAAFLDELRKRGKIPSPLLLALRAANKMAESLINQPGSRPTEAQRRALLAAGAQIRNLARGILASADAADPNTVEYELAQLILRTLQLIEHVTAEPPTIEVTVVPPEQLEKPRR